MHKDLSFENVRLQCINNNDIIVKLVNFNLVNHIENCDSIAAASNKTETIFFMLIEILDLIPSSLWQKQHKDKNAFWLRLLLLFKYYFKGCNMQYNFFDQT